MLYIGLNLIFDPIREIPNLILLTLICLFDAQHFKVGRRILSITGHIHRKTASSPEMVSASW